MTHNLALCLFGDVQSSFKTIRETKQIHQNYLEKNNVKGIYKPTQALSLGEGAVQVRIHPLPMDPVRGPQTMT